MQITFLGAGAFGRALASVAEDNGHTITFYDPFQYPDISLEDACAGAEVIIYVAPTTAADELLPKLPDDIPLFCASKGFLSAEPFARFISFGALAGAGYASDYLKHTSQVTQQFFLTASLPLASKIFATNWLTIEQTPDTLGVLLCGALKNVYAYGAGLLGTQPTNLSEFRQDSAEYTKSHQYLRAVRHEIRDILRANDADPATFDLSCGLPDLALTCTEQSRNFRAGHALATNRPLEPTTIEALSILQNIPADFIIPPTARIFRSIQRAHHGR